MFPNHAFGAPAWPTSVPSQPNPYIQPFAGGCANGASNPAFQPAQSMWSNQAPVAFQQAQSMWSPSPAVQQSIPTSNYGQMANPYVVPSQNTFLSVAVPKAQGARQAPPFYDWNNTNGANVPTSNDWNNKSDTNGSGWSDDSWSGGKRKGDEWTDNQNSDSAENGWAKKKKKKKDWSNTEWKDGWNAQEKEEVEEVDEDIEAVPHASAFLQPLHRVSDLERQQIIAKRTQLEISVRGEGPHAAAAPMTTFAELEGVLPDYMVGALNKNGIVAPMAIQAQTLPFTLRGFDLIGIAKTGSGKTLAFLLPAITRLEREPPMPEGEAAPSALILAPVRELAVQIAEEANKILWYSKSERHPEGVGALALYGGGFRIRNQQLRDMQKGYCHIVVGTPGRMTDFLDTGDLKLNRVIFLALDEADRMLEEGFGDQMASLEGQLRPDRQTMFFSATWPKTVRALARKMCKAAPIRVNVGQKEEEDGQCGPATRKDIMQEVVVFEDLSYDKLEEAKQALLYPHLRSALANPANKVLVFVNRKDMTWELAEKLNGEGFSCDFMYGGRSQDARHEVVRKLKEAEIKLLVSTDVMARGLDIPGISHVVVYDCYGGIDEYVHRIGRTARGVNGTKGHALTFYEWDHKYAEMPGDLVNLLQQSGNRVPPELQKIADEVADGTRTSKYKKW